MMENNILIQLQIYLNERIADLEHELDDLDISDYPYDNEIYVSTSARLDELHDTLNKIYELKE